MNLWRVTCIYLENRPIKKNQNTIDGHHDIDYKNMLLLGAYYLPKKFWFGHVNTSHGGNIKWVISDLKKMKSRTLAIKPQG